METQDEVNYAGFFFFTSYDALCKTETMDKELIVCDYNCTQRKVLILL